MSDTALPARPMIAVWPVLVPQIQGPRDISAGVP